MILLDIGGSPLLDMWLTQSRHKKTPRRWFYYTLFYMEPVLDTIPVRISLFLIYE